MKRAVDVRVKRAYEPAAASDGERVLIDRIWPRGVTREQAHLVQCPIANRIPPTMNLRSMSLLRPVRKHERRPRAVAVRVGLARLRIGRLDAEAR